MEIQSCICSQNAMQLQLNTESVGKLSSWKSKQFMIPEAPCMVEPLCLCSNMGMRHGDDRLRGRLAHKTHAREVCLAHKDHARGW